MHITLGVVVVAWKTFWMEPAGVSRVALRRYTSAADLLADGCVAGWHEAHVWTGDEVPTIVDLLGVQRSVFPVEETDPRWPAICQGCGRPFEDGDERQVWTERLYRRADTGDLRVLHSKMQPPDVPMAEPGAMWDAVWIPEPWRGPDGISLMVRCPRNDGGPGMCPDWPVDMPSTGSGGLWVRAGDPRAGAVTVSPSISIGKDQGPGSYHGWLQDGVLSDPL